jgi:hypothetical protein
MSLRLDHVTVAGQSLAELEEAFSAADLRPDYGGPHSNGVTHMSLVGFADGSYLELISVMDPGGPPAPWWRREIAEDAGLCAWAVEVEDVAAEAARVARLGIPIEGPRVGSRRQPDGTLAEWSMAFLGQPPSGAVLPFIIRDRTPRDHRVRPSGSVALTDGAGMPRPERLTGIARIVIGVGDLSDRIRLFRHVYGWPAPEQQEDAAFGASLAHFTGTPVVLAAPLSQAGWLARRLEAGGDAPCACLLAAPDVARAASRYRLYGRRDWFDGQVAWFDPARLRGIRLGVVGARDAS